MMTTSRHLSRKMIVVFAAFAVTATSVMPAQASPVDPSTTTSTPAVTTTNPDGSTTTVSADGSTTTTPSATTTIPGSTETTILPLYTGPTDANGIDQPPTNAVKPDTTAFPEGKVGEKKSGADLTASANLVGPAIPGFIYMGIVYVTNIGNEDAGAKSPVSFALDSIPSFVKLLDVSPTVNADSSVGAQGWDCKGVQCVWVEKTEAGIKNALLKSAATAQADLRFDIAADAVIPVPPADLLDEIKAKSTAGDLLAFNAVLKKVTHLSAIANETGDIDTKNNEAVVQLNGVEQDSGVQAGSTKRVKSAFGANGAGIAGVYIESKIKGPVFPGGPFHMEVRFLPTGSETQSGKIKFSDIVAPALALTKVKVSGAGWTCDSVTSPTSCSRTGADIKPGTYTDALVIDARVGKTAPVGDKPLSWVITSNSTTALDATPIEGSQTLSVDVRETPEPDLAVRLVPRDEKSSISPPGSLTVDALVRSVYGPAQDAHLLFSMRKGLIFKGLDADTVGWTCKSATPDEAAGEGGTAQDCVKAEMESDEPETVSIIVGTTEETEAGPAQVIAAISAANEAEKYKDGNRVAHTLVVQPLPAPMPGLVFTRPNEKGVVQAVSDGSATKILIGKDAAYAFSVKNQGSKALEAGSVVRFEQFVDDTAIFSGAAFATKGGYTATLDSQKISTATAGKWVCVTGNGTMPKVDMPVEATQVASALKGSTTVAPSTSAAVAAAAKKAGPAVRCEIKLASAVAPDAATPVLNLTVRASEKAKVGSPEWPVFASLVAIKQAPVARFGMTVAITEFAADLVPSFIAPAGPRPGGNAVATLNIKNSGNADAASQFLVVPGIKDGRITSIKGDSWKCARLGSALAAGFTICSRTAALKAGSDSPSLSIDYVSTNTKTTALNLQAASLVATSRNVAAGRASKLPVALRPALSFTVKGPKTIVDQLVDVKGNRVPSTILFSTEGNGDGAVYSWKQLCTTDADVKASNGECKAVTPVAKWFEDSPSTGPTATLITPTVTAETTLLFEVTATEGGASSTARASIVVVPLTTVEGPTGKSASGGGSSVLHRVPKQSSGSTRVFAATAPTSGTGDATFTTTSDTGVAVNGNVFGGSTVTVAQSGAVSLTAAASGVGAVTYAWSQASGPNPSVLAAAVTNTATVAFTAPAANTTVALRVEATDSRGAKASDIITVVVGTGGTATVAATITEGDGPIVVDTASAFTLNATATGTGAITYAWTQVSGTTLTLTNATTAALTVAATGVSGSATLLVTATDASGAKATDQVVLQLAPSGAPAPLCDFVAAASSKSLTGLQATIDAIGIGGLDLTKFAVSTATCTAASKVSFADAGFSLGSYLTVSGASGSVSATGLNIRTARFTGPADWGSPQFAIAATDAVGLFIPFSRAGVSIGAFEGEIIAASMPFLKLPAGYTASSALRFSVDAEGTKAVSLDAEATSAAVAGKTPTARVYGAVATNGTFTLEGSMTNAVNLFGTVVDFAGKVTKTDPTKNALVSLSGSLEGPVTLTSGVVLNGLAAKRDETGVVTGSGTMTVGTDPSALVLTANLSYTDVNNHSLAVTATAPNGSWTPAKDFVIPLASASGSYTMTAGARNIAIKVVGSNSTPMTGLAIKTPTIDATATCAAGAASCAVKVDLSADAEITLGSTATTGKLTGTFDIAAKSGSFKASIGAIPVVAGLSLTGASLAVDSTKVGAADQTTTVTLSGSAVVFEKTVTATAVFSKTGVLLTADLPELAIFGASGPVFKPGQLSWSSGAITGFTPKVPSLPNIKPVNLLAKVPRLNAAIALPTQVKDFAASVVTSAGDIALDGDVNFETGQFSLAASLTSDSIDASGSISRAKTGDPYKYNLTGNVKKPIVLNSSVTLKTLAYTFGNDVAGGAVKFDGTGGVDVTLPDSTVLSVNGALTYTSSTSYSLAITVGAAATSFAVSGGEALSLGTATGSFVRNATGTTLNVAMSSSVAWKPVSGLTVSNVAATAALTCNTGATCVPTFNVTGTLGFDLGITGLNTAVVSGSLDTSGFKFSATFNDLIFSTTGDIKLTAPTLALSIPAKTSTDKAAATLSGNFSMFGATLAGSMTFSSAGVLLLGTVPAFKFTNSDIGFDGGQFAWLLKAPSSINWTPTVPNLTLPAVSLPVGVPKMRLSMPIPDAVKQLSATGGAAFGAVTVSGDMTLATGAFSMAASYASTNIDASGSVSRADKATALTYSLAVAVKAPVTVVDGVAVKTLNMTLSNATGSTIINGSGEITISTPTDPITLGFGLNYTSSTQYSFNIAVAPGNTTSWTPFSGFTLPLGNITGSMARNGNTKTFAASFKSTSEWVPFPGAKIAEPGAAINGTCTVGSACVLTFTASGKVSVDVGSGWQGPATLTGTFGKDASSLTATFPDLTVTTGVVIKAPSLSLGYSKAGGITGTVAGSSDVLGTTLAMSATFSSKGVVVAGSMNDWTPVAGITLTGTTFAYSTYALANVTLASAPSLGNITLAAGKPSLIAGFSVPSWLRDLLKQPTLTVVPVNIPLSDLAGGKLPTIKIMLPTPDNWYMYKSGGSSMRFTALGFEVSGSPTPSMSLIGQTEMLTGASNETPIPLEMRGTVTPSSISLSLSLGLDKNTGNPFAWKNAFGISDLTLTEAAIQIGITLTAPIPLPSLGIAATAQLPATWRSLLNMDAGVAVRLVANIDVSKPCFQLQAGTLGADNKTISAGTAKVASIAGGALTSTYMNLTIAPLGCTVGNVVVEPGVSAGFVGTVFGTNVSVNARIGTSPFSLEADMAIGAFNVGPVKLDETRMGIKVSPTDNYISFAGGVTIGNTKVSVSGKAGANTTDGPYLDMTGSISNLVIVPSFLEVSNAQVTMNLKPAKGFANIVASGSFNILGTPSTVALNMQMSNYQLQSLTASLQTRRTIASIVTIDGTFNIAYSKGAAPTLDFNAVASVAGYALGTATGRIDGNQASILGTVQVGGVFSAQIGGQVVWQAASGVNITNRAGQSVAAAAGDFRIAATNIGMNLGGFGASGNVVIGRAQGLVYGDFNASFAIGAGDVGGTVYVAGSFGSDGNFSFTGSGNLNLVAFGAAVSVSGYKSGGNWGFAMSSNITVMGSVNVGFSGSFYKTGSTTRFTMTGSAALNAAGIGGGSGNFRISNEPGQAGVYADVRVNIAGISGGGSLWVGADGTFDTSLYVGVNFPGVSTGGWLKIGNVAWWNGQRYRGNSYFQIDAWLNFAGVWFRMWGNINGDGSFQFTAAAGPWSWGTYINAGFVQLSFGTSFASYITITSWAPYISIYIGGSAWMDWSWPECWWGGGRWSRYFRCGWGGWSRAINAGMGFNTNPGNVWINLWGYGFNIR